MKKMYCLVVTNDYNRFSWVFFLATKDKTSEILKIFITGIENLIDLKVKVIRCDNGTEFKNKVMNQFCEMKGIKREFSVARTPQQNGVAERKNKTLIEAAKTMLADSKLLTTFWAKAVNTACYVQNRVLVIKPQNKTPYEPFLGKFDGKADEGFFVGYSTNRSGPEWLFNIDTLTKSMNYKLVAAGNQTNGNAGTKKNIDIGQAGKKIVPDQEYILLPLLTSVPSLSKSLKDSPDAGFKPLGKEENMDAEHLENEDNEVPNTEEPRVNQEQDESINSTNNINTVSLTINTASIEANAVDENIVYGCIDDPNMPNLEEIVYSDDDEEVGAEADMNNLAKTVHVSPILTTRIHKDHPLEQIIGDIHSEPQNRRMTKSVTEHDGCEEGIFVWHNWEEVYVCQPPGFEDLEFPNKVYKVEKALYDLHQAPRAWYETLSTYLLENGFRRGAIDKTLFIKKQRLIIYDAQEIPDEFYGGAHFLLRVAVKTSSTPMETNKALIKDKEAEDMDVHLYRSMIGSLMYLTVSRPDIMFAVCACARFQVTPKTSHLNAVKRIFRYLKGQPKLGLWYPRDSPFDLEAFSDSDYAGASLDRKSTIGAEYVAATNCCGQVLWIQNQMLDYGFNFMNTKIYIDNESTICIVKNPVFHSKTKHIEIRHHFIRDSYEKKLIQVIKIHTDQNVADLLTKAFDASRVKTAKAKHIEYLVGDEAVHKELGDRMERAATTASSLEAEQDSGASLDRKSTTRAEYVAASSCCGQVLWIQNQMLDYGYNFMNTKIFIDNESTICIVKNPVFHSKTKHIEIRHHFIKDSYEKRLIQVIKIHTDHNVVDLLTKAFDSSGPIPFVSNETAIKEWEDKMERASTTASSLEAEQDSGSGLRCQDTILGVAKAQIRFEVASKQSNDPPLSRVNTLGSGEDNMKLKELMEFCTKLSERAFDL
ncbi:putative ribonuclease H-like domain-containing protein [Tanacetum coccineum]|uniref:Ribonuclease H-like domain-containing protein n=1 Tax=Tanacetum coccineum TaxID=301880 RepID=A0ABQ4YT98_9ASTR